MRLSSRTPASQLSETDRLRFAAIGSEISHLPRANARPGRQALPAESGQQGFALTAGEENGGQSHPGGEGAKRFRIPKFANEAPFSPASASDVDRLIYRPPPFPSRTPGKPWRTVPQCEAEPFGTRCRHNHRQAPARQLATPARRRRQKH